jgi:hypothetical protein
MTPKIKALTFNHILVTAEKPVTSSLILPDDKGIKFIKEIQTVVKVGPFCAEGTKIQEGDKVMLDPTRLKALSLYFNKLTGEIMPSETPVKEIDEFGVQYILVHDRDVIAILE